MFKNLLSRIKLFALGTSQWGFVGSLLGFSSTRVVLSRQELERLYQGWVFIAVSARAEDVGNIEFQLFKTTKKGDEEIFDHPLLSLLSGFNPLMTKAEAVGLISAHLDIFGRAYLRILKKQSQTYLMPLMPDEVIPDIDDDGILKKYVYKRRTKSGQTKEITLKIEEVIPFKLPNPLSIDSSYSKMQGIYEWIETDYQATYWNKNFFKNFAIPAGLLKPTRPLGEQEKTRLAESFREMFAGSNNAHKIGVLPHGTDFEKMSDSMKDMDFTNLDVRYQNKILSAFGVPRSRIGITDDVNRANAEATNYVYALRSIKPQMEKIVDILNVYLVPQFGEELYLTFKSPVPEDKEAKLKENEQSLKGQPYKTVNEVREEQGLPKVENGDVLMTTLQYIELGEPIKQVKAAENVTISKRKGFSLVTKRLDSGEKKEAVKAFAKHIAEAWSKKVEDYASPELDAADHKQFVRRGNQREKAIIKAVQAVNSKIEKDTIKNLEEIIERVKGNDKIETKALATDRKAFIAVVIQGLSSPLTEIASEESKLTQENLGIAGNYVISTGLEKQVDRFMKKLGKSYASTTIDEIEKEIKNGLTGGESIKEIARNLKNNVFDRANDVRANAIARSEVYRFANLGLRDGYSDSGVVKTVRWYTAPDDVCEYCQGLNGKVIQVDQNFFDQGQSVIGVNGGVLSLDYSDVLAGPLHPNCRCYVRPDQISIL